MSLFKPEELCLQKMRLGSEAASGLAWRVQSVLRGFTIERISEQ